MHGWRIVAGAAAIGLCGCMAGAARGTTEGTYLGQQAPEGRPVVFMKGTVSSKRFEHGAVAIAPDLSEIYWSSFFEGQEPYQRILFIRRDGTGWTEPASAPFVGAFSSGEPFFAGSADRLGFRADRPLRAGRGLDRSYWVTRRTPSGWSEPEPLGEIFLGVGFQASMAANGTLYFTTDPAGWRDTRGDGDICRAVLRDGTYAPPENLGAPINTPAHDWSPCIAADERWMIFASTRPGGKGQSDLYVSFHGADGAWGDPINVGRPINTGQNEDWPSLSPDGRFLFFVRKGDVYWVDAGFLSKLAAKASPQR